MGRAATEAFLNECEGGDPLGKKQAEHLDRLFVRVDEVASKHPPTATAIKMGYAEPIANLPSAPTVVDVGGDGKYSKARESAYRVYGRATVVDISIPLPFFKLVSLALSRFSLF